MLPYPRKAAAVVLALSLVLPMLLLSAETAVAASVTQFSDNMSRVQASVTADHTIMFVTPTGVDAPTDTIVLTFGNNFNLGTIDNTNVDLAVGNSGTCSSATFVDKTVNAAAGSGVWGVSKVGQAITLTPPTNAIANEITAGRCVQIEIGTNAGGATSQITNGLTGNTAGSKLVLSGGFGDTGTLMIPIITNDQVVVTATVDTTLSFTVSHNSISFGTLSPSAARYATNDGLGSNSETVGHSLTASTNASSGYVVYVKGDTLKNNANGTLTIQAIGGTAAGSNPGSEQFGIKVAASGGSGTLTTPYNATNFAYAATAASQDEIAHATQPSDLTTYNVTYLANIGALTEAGAYSTTLTYTATGTF